MFFLRKANLERLPVAMIGVRMGERVLQIGVDDPSLLGAIAAKVGLSGHAAVAVPDERQAARARAGTAAAGALADVQMTTAAALPFADEAFDVVVLHAAAIVHALSDQGAPLLSDSRRVLRAGGRIVIIEGRGRGLLTRIRPAAPSDPARALQALTMAGFKAARLLAEREGYRFFEAVR
ncbi:MAG: methyltransferase domain-containing protein [Acidobacteria bacterium]|nr:methyltransferase domain-containing protein [Acidobacteriota bacterium]